MPSIVKVVIVNDAGLGADRTLRAALDQAGLPNLLEQMRARLARPLRIVIKPDLGAFAPNSPTATDPKLVEILVGILHELGHLEVVVGSAVEESSTWSDNRDAFSIADLLGYKFVAATGRPYDIADLSSNVDDHIFPPGNSLHGTGLSSIWGHADARIVFSKNTTDEFAGYALGLESLIGVLPLADKFLHYRNARDPGEAVADLLHVAPVHFAIIDALVSAHGAGGRRSPVPIETGTIIASPSIALADQIGAIKMGLDPFRSPIFTKVVERHGLPRRYEIQGSLAPYSNWQNVPAVLIKSNNYRAGSPDIERIVRPWLQRLDSDFFPLKSPIDAQVNRNLADFLRDTDSSPTARWLLVAANVFLGTLGHIFECYATLANKDALRQKAVGLGIDPTAFGEHDFAALVNELKQIEALVAEAPVSSPGFRWRYLDEAVLFSYSRTLPIAFEAFVDRVEIARTIQFMNDYLGGVIIELARDERGRPIRQSERNLYLPQPNYMVFYHGQLIDVTKLEVVEYQPDQHRLYWKTVRSENNSATFDDGIATFTRSSGGTTITITGRQLFTLPLLWQIVDLNSVPDIKAVLVNHAYREFFDRTVANLEALVEGRNIRLGLPADEPARRSEDWLAPLLRRAGEIIVPLLHGMNSATTTAAQTPGTLDADGFIHARPNMNAESAPSSAWIEQISHFVRGFSEAVQRDLEQRDSR
jgi:uncharacterized protein (DUF362 family)